MIVTFNLEWSCKRMFKSSRKENTGCNLTVLLHGVVQLQAETKFKEELALGVEIIVFDGGMCTFNQ